MFQCHDFPRAEIYELISPDLLHQIIKGTFKDHLVEWYLSETHGEARVLEIIADIDHRISAVPSFPGLDDSLMAASSTSGLGGLEGADESACCPFLPRPPTNSSQVFVAAIAGHVLSEMVKCISAFLDFCYLVRRNAPPATNLMPSTKS
ncbi:hypothetical protein B0H13DRAFT_2302264 [Mycena leptocephala]|nr:hypothetical protein B0H13DRAFT_2302264 [Mycena leptocephala]